MNTAYNIEETIIRFHELNLHQVIDFDKFNEFAITHHSTAIEGSTLTETETRLLLEDGITPNGKPLVHSLMVRDHYEALRFIMESAAIKTELNAGFIKDINARVMRGTGNLYNTPLGQVNASKGEYRKGNVSAGGSYFMNYDKVSAATDSLSSTLVHKLQEVKTIKEKLELSFAAHFDLVTIHPFYDGNGRTSRLLMNFLQARLALPLSIVFKEDKNDYYAALTQSRKAESHEPFYNFMYNQYQKQLTAEIEKAKGLFE